jgi:hypothetical protein
MLSTLNLLDSAGAQDHTVLKENGRYAKRIRQETIRDLNA